jgi:hypothetical protein
LAPLGLALASRPGASSRPASVNEIFMAASIHLIFNWRLILCNPALPPPPPTLLVSLKPIKQINWLWFSSRYCIRSTISYGTDSASAGCIPGKIILTLMKFSVHSIFLLNQGSHFLFL